MTTGRNEYSPIRAVLEEADTEKSLTAREIVELLEERGEEFESSHRVATVLGRRADAGDIEPIQGRPYRYA